MIFSDATGIGFCHSLFFFMQFEKNYGGILRNTTEIGEMIAEFLQTGIAFFYRDCSGKREDLHEAGLSNTILPF